MTMQNLAFSELLKTIKEKEGLTIGVDIDEFRAVLPAGVVEKESAAEENLFKKTLKIMEEEIEKMDPSALIGIFIPPELGGGVFTKIEIITHMALNTPLGKSFKRHFLKLALRRAMERSRTPP